ncbi:MAG: hypothetical protein JMDDDDMK_02157 [Acidobacteria bacterium]|nr:hypothetical protein [Acidobacteriota bacterium]
MTYEADLRRRIQSSDLWPDFERPEFLDDLDSLAEQALNRATVEGALAALLIYHQLSEEMVRLLVRDSQFFIQLAVFPAEISFPNRPRQMFGQLLDDLRHTVSFPERDEILSLCEDINKRRNDLVHRLTRRTTLADILLSVQDVQRCYSSLYQEFEQAHDYFRVSFHSFKKDTFSDDY